MTLIVSDTSPVTNLIKIGLLSLLRDVYGQIIIPQSVYEELCEIESQKTLFYEQPWVEVMAAQDRAFVKTLEIELDRGESESIALAIELKADFLIIDESSSRQKAESLGIDIIGLLGTLLKAKELGIIPRSDPSSTTLLIGRGSLLAHS